jgi:AraC family transcriptional regulator
MDYTLQAKPSSTIAFVDHGGFLSEISQAFSRLVSALGPQGLARSGRLVTVLRDGRQGIPSGWRACAAVELTSSQVPESPGVGVSRLPAGSYAVAMHRGPYSGLPAAWVRFRAELAAGGISEAGGVRFQVHLDDPETVPESDLRTELYELVSED